MPIVPLFGHEALRTRLERAVRRGVLPASLLLHGPAGVGKQRLALHLASALLCTTDDAPCGRCQSCRYAAELTHPDLHWYFPRARPKDGDQTAAEVEGDYAEAVAERVRSHGLYRPPSGSEGLFVSTVRAMLQQASLSPAVARRKVLVVGDAERMVSQEGADQAANAFLKLLEEPPENTTIILTTSEPGALLPTIRSRVVAVRVAALPPAAVRAFVEDATVSAWLDRTVSRSTPDARVEAAAGRPGALLASDEQSEGRLAAERLLAALESGSRARWLRLSFAMGSTKARGGFASTLDALALLLHGRIRSAVDSGDDGRALRLARAMTAVDETREQARGNVTPQLAGAALARELAGALR